MKGILVIITALTFCCVSTMADTNSSTQSNFFKSPVSTYDSLFNTALNQIYSQPDSAVKIVNLLFSQRADTLDDNWHIRLLNLLGILHDVKSEYDSSLHYYYQAYGYAAKKQNLEHLGNTSNNIGLSHWNTGNFKDALDFFFRALEYYDEAGVNEARGNIHNNIGLIHAGLGNHEIAMEHYQKARFYFEENQDMLGLGALQTNIGLLFLSQENADSAMHYVKLSLDTKKKADDVYGQCISWESMGRVYLFISNVQASEKAFSESLILSQSIGYTFGIGRAYMGLANVALKNRDSNKSLSLAGLALEAALKTESDLLIYKVHETLSDIMEQKGNHAAALEHFRTATRLRNETINHSRLYQVYSLEKQYATQRNLQEIIQLNQEKEIQQLTLDRKNLEINRKNSQILFLLIIFALISSGMILMYYFRRHVQQARVQKTIMDLKEARSRAVMETELLERNRIGRELHDGLGQILSVIRLNLRVLKKKDVCDRKQLNEVLDSSLFSIDSALKELRSISQNLAPMALSDMSLEEALRAMALQVNQSREVNLRLEMLGLDFIKDKMLNTTLYRCIQELVNNSLKHSEATEIQVQLICDEDQVSLMVEDNGKGFDESKFGNSNGLGLKNIQSRIENIGGSFFIDSMKNRGCNMQICIPLQAR